MEFLQSISLHESTRFSIPAEARSLDSCLFPLQLHGRHAALQEEMHRWAKASLGHLLSEAQIMKISKAGYGWLACSFWPNSVVPERSLTLLKLMYWFIIFDDAIDNSVSMCRDAESAHGYCTLFLDALFNSSSEPQKELLLRRQYRSESEVLPLLVAKEWWAEMRRDGMPAAQQQRFRAAVTDYVMAQVSIVRLNELMEAGRPPSVQDFVAIRRVAVGAPLCFLASEYDLGIQLDAQTLAHPLLVSLHAAISDHVAWLNDIFSFPKEFNRGEFLNLLSLLHIHNNVKTVTNNIHYKGPLSPASLPTTHIDYIPLHLAITQAWDMTKDRQQECAKLAQEIIMSPHLAHHKPCLQNYVNAVCSITSGNWAWSLNCSRYNSHTMADAASYPDHMQVATTSYATTPSLLQASLTTPQKHTQHLTSHKVTQYTHFGLQYSKLSFIKPKFLSADSASLHLQTSSTQRQFQSLVFLP